MKYFDAIQAFLFKLGSMLFLVLAPIHSVLLALTVLILADFSTGIWAAKKLKERITSNNMKKTAIKFVVYFGAIIVGFTIENLVPDVPLVKVISGVLALIEGKSFFENIHKISGIDFWTAALSKIQQATTKEQPPTTVEPTPEEEPEKPKKRKKRKNKKK